MKGALSMLKAKTNLPKTSIWFQNWISLKDKTLLIDQTNSSQKLTKTTKSNCQKIRNSQKNQVLRIHNEPNNRKKLKRNKQLLG